MAIPRKKARGLKKKKASGQKKSPKLTLTKQGLYNLILELQESVAELMHQSADRKQEEEDDGAFWQIKQKKKEGWIVYSKYLDFFPFDSDDEEDTQQASIEFPADGQQEAINLCDSLNDAYDPKLV